MAPTEKKNVIVAIVFDFETGGLDPVTCAATQISLHAVRLDTFETMEKYSAYIKPYNKRTDLGKTKRKTLKNKYEDDNEKASLMLYEDKALEYSDISMETLKSQGEPLEQVCDEICQFISRNTLPVSGISNRPFLVGQNPQFDNGFMQQIMLYTDKWGDFCKLVRGNVDFWGNFQPALLDTIMLAQLALDHDKSITTWKLESTAERLGVELDDAHDADADVTATKDIVRVLTSRMRQSPEGGKAIGSLAPEKKEKLRDHFKI